MHEPMSASHKPTSVSPSSAAAAPPWSCSCKTRSNAPSRQLGTTAIVRVKLHISRAEPHRNSAQTAHKSVRYNPTSAGQEPTSEGQSSTSAQPNPQDSTSTQRSASSKATPPSAELKYSYMFSCYSCKHLYCVHQHSVPAAQNA